MKSIWMEDYDTKRKSVALEGSIETDTVIVGGGLAGILCADRLKKCGIDAVVVEAKRVGMGVTQNTTAKITAQHGLVYKKIEKQYGLQAAKDYFAANQQAVESYRTLSRNISCDFEEKTAYVYSIDHREKLKEEADVYHRMGVEAVWTDSPSIPVRTVGALGMEGQGQFHPIKFLNALIKDLTIYENTFVTDIQPGRVLTKRGEVRARRVILATHYPMVNLPGLYVAKLYQHRSYVLALTGVPNPDGMYIDESGSGLSFRSYGDHLLLGGGGHRTGKKGGGWRELRQVAKAIYPDGKEGYHWATQDCMSLDALPYIGRHHQNNRELYVTTGFHKWGMTGSMVAARVLGELLTEGNSRYAKLFCPSRSMLHPQLFANVGQAVWGLVSFGKRCPHMGCALKWNPQEHSWDCPCHGSRFTREGELIDNPAKRGIDIER